MPWELRCCFSGSLPTSFLYGGVDEHAIQETAVLCCRSCAWLDRLRGWLGVFQLSRPVGCPRAVDAGRAVPALGALFFFSSNLSFSGLWADRGCRSYPPAKCQSFRCARYREFLQLL